MNSERRALTPADDGTYLIYTAENLKEFADIVNGTHAEVQKNKSAHARLMNDINLKDVCGPTLNGGSPVSWTPIGSDSNKYTSTFDGNNYTISGLSADESFFGGVGQDGTVQNLTASGSVSSSGNYVGGIVGNNNSGTVTNCYYMQSTASAGVGNESDNSGAILKTADEFQSGKVAYLLEQNVADSEKPVWGQNLTDPNSWPALLALDDSAKTVYEVTVNYNYDGAQTNETRYTNSDLKALTPQNRDGYTFDGWFTDEACSGNPVTTITAETTTLYAKWTAVYTVSVTAGEGGEVSGGGTFAENESVTVTATPASGYTFVEWQENGEKLDGAEAIYTFELTSDRTLTAIFEPEPEDPDDNPSTPSEPSAPSKPDTYPPTVEDTDHGSVEIDNNKPEAGDTVTITPKPDDGYNVDAVIVTDKDGNRVEVTDNPDGSWSYTQPESDVTIEVIFGEIQPEPTTSVSDVFADVAPNAWYTAAIQYAYDNGLMTGVSDTEFAPNATTTRAETCSILARLENITSAESAGFTDVNDEWYATAVNWAASENIVAGFEDNTFRPNTPITREQLAAILMNYSAYKGQDTSNRADLANYSDQPSAWAEETMQWAVAEGLISGVTNTELQPQGNATRAQVAAILQRFLAE